MSTFDSKERQEKQHQKKKRKVTSCQATAEDYAALREHYTFLPPGTSAVSSLSSSTAVAAATTATAASSFLNPIVNNIDNKKKNNATSSTSSSWQSRMVARYHEHLDKEYVLANMTRVHSPHHQLGLRWRTKKEAESGKGSTSCGNLHCPATALVIRKNNKRKTSTTTDDGTTTTAGSPSSTDDDNDEKAASIQRYLQNDEQEEQDDTEEREVARLAKLAPGILLTDYIVPFTYQEHGKIKTQLVKLQLCAVCAPLLFLSQGNTTNPSLTARRARK